MILENPNAVIKVPQYLTIEGTTFERKTIVRTSTPGVAYVPPVINVIPGVYINRDENTFTPSDEIPFYIFLTEARPIYPISFGVFVGDRITQNVYNSSLFNYYNVLNPNLTTNTGKSLSSQMKYQLAFTNVGSSSPFTAPVSQWNVSKQDFQNYDPGTKIIWGFSYGTAFVTYPEFPNYFQPVTPLAPATDYIINLAFDYLVIP